MRRQVWLLFACQALMNCSVIGQAVMGALIGYSLAADKALATLPMAIQMTATMAASIPAGIVFARLGRRPGFLLGALAALAGSLTFAAGIWFHSFALYCLGAVPAGIGFGIAQHYRFAAAEVASAEYRPRAIGLVMTGGLLSAALGPEIVKHTRELAAPLLFLGTYLALAVLPVVVMALLTWLRAPPPPPRVVGGAGIGSILARPAFVSAVVAAMVAYGTMNLVMTSTPLEMMLCGFGVDSSATVIQVHAIAMFGPGFVTGRLVGRFGARPVIFTGGALSAACALIAVTGVSLGHFLSALILLGIGWNFMFVGATALLATAYAPEERVRAQVANDLIVFGTVACTAFLSGAVHARAGWEALNLSILPPLAVALALLLWQRARAARPVAAA